MRLVITRRVEDDNGYHEYEAMVDLDNADDAYVQGRKFNQLTNALARGMNDEYSGRGLPDPDHTTDGEA